MMVTVAGLVLVKISWMLLMGWMGACVSQVVLSASTSAEFVFGLGVRTFQEEVAPKVPIVANSLACS